MAAGPQTALTTDSPESPISPLILDTSRVKGKGTSMLCKYYHIMLTMTTLFYCPFYQMKTEVRDPRRILKAYR